MVVVPGRATSVKRSAEGAYVVSPRACGFAAEPPVAPVWVEVRFVGMIECGACADEGVVEVERDLPLLLPKLVFFSLLEHTLIAVLSPTFAGGGVVLLPAW